MKMNLPVYLDKKLFTVSHRYSIRVWPAANINSVIVVFPRTDTDPCSKAHVYCRSHFPATFVHHRFISTNHSKRNLGSSGLQNTKRYGMSGTTFRILRFACYEDKIELLFGAAASSRVTL